MLGEALVEDRLFWAMARVRRPGRGGTPSSESAIAPARTPIVSRPPLPQVSDGVASLGSGGAVRRECHGPTTKVGQ